MTFHILSTANGEENEGMRNVATHLSRELAREHTVLASSLHDLAKLPGRCRKADCTLIFVRCLAKVYPVVRLCAAFSKRTFLFLVQKPDAGFLARAAKHPLKASCFTACAEDAAELKLAAGFSVYELPIGINAEKFRPVSARRRAELKRQYGFEPDRPLVLHVGHCSAGRGLEDFARIDPQRFERMAVASGMFESEQVRSVLADAGVRVHTGYLPNVNEVYQMADVYLFPTRSGEFVISVPLSVMEALACGVPVVGYASFAKLNNVRSVPGGLCLIRSADELNEALATQAKRRGEISLLPDAKSWAQATQTVLETIERELHTA